MNHHNKPTRLTVFNIGGKGWRTVVWHHPQNIRIWKLKDYVKIKGGEVWPSNRRRIKHLEFGYGTICKYTICKIYNPFLPSQTMRPRVLVCKWGVPIVINAICLSQTCSNYILKLLCYLAISYHKQLFNNLIKNKWMLLTIAPT